MASSAEPAVLIRADDDHHHHPPQNHSAAAAENPGGPRKCRGPLLKAVIQHFSSTPLDPDPELLVTGHSSAVLAPFDATPDATPPPHGSSSPPKPHPHGNRFSSTPLRPPPSSSLAAVSPRALARTGPSPFAAFEGRVTEGECAYLEGLWQSGTQSDLEAALKALNDAGLFFVNPPTAVMADQEEKKEDSCGVDDIKTDVVVVATPPPSPRSPPQLDRRRRDPRLQQQLFRWHETQAVPPSQVLHRLTLVHRNSLLLDSSFSDGGDAVGVDDSDAIGEETGATPHHPRTQARHTNSILAASLDQDDGSRLEDDDDDVNAGGDPFDDVSSWLDGSPAHFAASDDPDSLLFSKPPFKILGTSADDSSCHPRVLSPPLMESLAAFVPELWTESHWWLRYSRSRDNGNLRHLLQVARSSVATILAIETTDGHVLGCFTTAPWRFSEGWYGAGNTGGTSSASFVWKMRRTRCLDDANSANARSSASLLVRQVCQESEIQVYPYRSCTNGDGSDAGSDDLGAVQRCTEVEGLQLGHTELADPGPHELEGLHYGHALSISPDLRTGSTSTSETFGNPCLVKGEWRGAQFDIANLELWTLTVHPNVGAAEHSALSALFRGTTNRPDTTNIHTCQSAQN